MRKLLISAGIAASMFAMSVGGAQAALSATENANVQGYVAALATCPATGTGNCNEILKNLNGLLSKAKISAADKNSFLKAAVAELVTKNPNAGVLTNIDAQFSNLAPTAGDSGCTFTAGSFSAGCA